MAKRWEITLPLLSLISIVLFIIGIPVALITRNIIWLVIPLVILTGGFSIILIVSIIIILVIEIKEAWIK